MNNSQLQELQSYVDQITDTTVVNRVHDTLARDDIDEHKKFILVKTLLIKQQNGGSNVSKQTREIEQIGVSGMQLTQPRAQAQTEQYHNKFAQMLGFDDLRELQRTQSKFLLYQRNLRQIKRLQAKIKTLLTNITDSNVRHEFERTYDEFIKSTQSIGKQFEQLTRLWQEIVFYLQKKKLFS